MESKKDKKAHRCEKCGFRIRGKNHNEGLHCQRSKGDRQASVGEK